MKLLRLLATLAMGLAVAAAPLRADDEKKKVDESTEAAAITIASWGGAYAKSQELAFIEPFRDSSGIEVKLVSHGGKFDGLKRKSDSEAPKWDVVDLGMEALEDACEEGLLEPISLDDIAEASGESKAMDDFLPGAVHKCGIASVAWSAAIAYDRRAFEGKQPKTAADFFDLETFPGNRAVPNDPKYLLPLALMADGVAPEDVYRELESEEGIMRALAKLEALRTDIIWWQNAHQPLKLLAEQKASMALAFNGRIFYATVRDNQPFGIIWDGQIYDLDMWAVPKGSPNREAALKFIGYSLQPDRLAAQTQWFPYGPMRKSAIAKIGKHAEVDVEMRDYVPTSDANFTRALRVDPAWWEKNGERLTERFEAWMVGPVTGSVAPADDDAKGEDAAEKSDAEDGEKAEKKKK